MTAVPPASPFPFAPFDPELERMLTATRGDGPAQPPVTLETLPESRAAFEAMSPSPAEVIGDRPVDFEERTIPGRPGAPELAVTVLRPRERAQAAPGLYSMHGGGLVMGTRHMDTPRLVDLVLEFGFVVVNVEYRLAPENPGAGPAEDCYAGLVWMAGHAEELGFDPDRLIVMGGSAGGCLSAAMALMTRDRKGPALAGQLLLVPMLDDRNETLSSHQYGTAGVWDRHINVFSWRAVLGDRVGDPDVSPYIVPSRATDLSGLAPAYIELGSAELLRDEAVEYANRIWAAGGEAELHVWNGGFHGFEVFCPDSRLAAYALETRRSWIRRVIGQ
ncbi:alpha/beta hydrolase [Streptosporangium carneum]|uniref:Esterase n=1 Tax=Streptosporangium carneum TaxID=47481 RepID=A0A9W6HZ03_9ACTN|nr:alpha/beta hydrolase [Streptosporangium carneum]GLK08985.1 esterase [Streptosporangium carneum]